MIPNSWPPNRTLNITTIATKETILTFKKTNKPYPNLLANCVLKGRGISYIPFGQGDTRTLAGSIRRGGASSTHRGQREDKLNSTNRF